MAVLLNWWLVCGLSKAREPITNNTRAVYPGAIRYMAQTCACSVVWHTPWCSPGAGQGNMGWLNWTPLDKWLAWVQCWLAHPMVLARRWPRQYGGNHRRTRRRTGDRGELFVPSPSALTRHWPRQSYHIFNVVYMLKLHVYTVFVI
jgi:hypothetical protein